MTPPTNPERDQDRVEDTIDTFRKYGYVVFPQQMRIYEQLSNPIYLGGKTVLEAGCGNGVGTGMMSRTASTIIGTDKLPGNVAFARCLYPWVGFRTWDLNEPWDGPKADVVVAVECFEHVTDPVKAMKHLIGAATETVWVTTPDGYGRDRTKPPENPHHVQEYTEREMAEFVFAATDRATMYVHPWNDLTKIAIGGSGVTPLVYQIELK